MMDAMSLSKHIDPDETPRRRWLLDLTIIVTLVLIGGWHAYDTLRAGQARLLAPEIDMIAAPDAAIMFDKGRVT